MTACAVAAIYVRAPGLGQSAVRDRPLLRRALVAAVLLGLGFAFKLYPAIFTLPLMLYVLTGGPGGRELPAGRALEPAGRAAGRADRDRHGRAGEPAVHAGRVPRLEGVVTRSRRCAHVDITTNSIWFWGFRPISDPQATRRSRTSSDVLSPTLILVSFVVACVIGWVRYRREGTYPWVAVSRRDAVRVPVVPQGALAAVHAVAGADVRAAAGQARCGWCCTTSPTSRWASASSATTTRSPTGCPYGIYDGLAAQATAVGVWGRAALLAVLFFMFLWAPATSDELDTSPPPQRQTMQSASRRRRDHRRLPGPAAAGEAGRPARFAGAGDAARPPGSRWTVRTTRVAGGAPYDVLLLFCPSCRTWTRRGDRGRGPDHRAAARCGWRGRSRPPGVATDLTEQGVRGLRMDHGLVDVKVCAIDATWSA